MLTANSATLYHQKIWICCIWIPHPNNCYRLWTQHLSPRTNWSYPTNLTMTHLFILSPSHNRNISLHQYIAPCNWFSFCLIVMESPYWRLPESSNASSPLLNHSPTIISTFSEVMLNINSRSWIHVDLIGSYSCFPSALLWHFPYDWRQANWHIVQHFLSLSFQKVTIHPLDHGWYGNQFQMWISSLSLVMHAFLATNESPLNHHS